MSVVAMSIIFTATVFKKKKLVVVEWVTSCSAMFMSITATVRV